MNDIFDKCSGDGGYFGSLRSSGDTFFTRPTLSPLPSTRTKFEDLECIMWSVNNYLGLANHPEVQSVAEKALQTYGISAPMGSRMMSGTTQFHLDLENDLAAFSQKEASILFNYGYLGVLGTISSLVTPQDTIIMDKLSHACIVDAAFLSQGTLRVFRHNSMNSLESVLRSVNNKRRAGVIILIEGVYGMTGDLAPLADITQLAKKYEARIFIDDAHGCGVMGEQGRGTADHFHVQDDIDIYFGTFAKAFGAIGGFSASSKAVVEWLTYNARPQVFAKSLPLIYTLAMKKMLSLIMSADDRRKVLWEKSKRLKTGLQNAGFTLGPGASPICSVFIPVKEEETTAMGAKAGHYLRMKGVFVTAVIYPVVPLGLCMFRLIPTSNHSDEEIDTTVQAFADLRDYLNIDLSFHDTAKAQLLSLYGVSSL